MKLQARTFWIYGDAEMKKYAMPVVMLAVFETVAVILWLTKGNLFYLFNFSYIGISVSLGVFLFIKQYKHHYSICINYITVEEMLSPDEKLLSFDALVEILTERIRNGNLQTVLEINLGYYTLDQNVANHTNETVWQLIPVWQIRGYDTSLDQLLNGVLSTCSEEDRIKYDPECVYSIYINALTGELVPAD